VFETYWCFAIERHSMYLRRLRGGPGPWTNDPVLRLHRFTNAYRAADRVSQYLIREVIYGGSADTDEMVFRVLLFKFFNKIETWELLRAALGEPTWADFDLAGYQHVLDRAKDAGNTLYSPAYVVPPPRFGEGTKHANHLRLLEYMMLNRLPDRILRCRGLGEVYEALRSFPSLGPFLAYQFSVDLNYSDAVQFSEMDFVVAGPGACDGIRKCFGPESAGIEEKVIEHVAEHQDQYFDVLGINFPGLFGRPLQLVDCQNLFCEVDKYARVVHPEISGVSGRQRIKQLYRFNPDPVPAWFPPKWNLTALPRDSSLTPAAARRT
jgi:hypothetical protein